MSDPKIKVKRLEEKVRRLTAQIENTTLLQAEKDRLEYEYHRSHRRFTTVFEKSAIGKTIIDQQLNIIKTNQAFVKSLGYTQTEILEKRVIDLTNSKFKFQWKKLQNELWTTDLASFDFDCCLIRKDGSLMWAHITAILIEDETGTLCYTIIEDISERKELERLKARSTEREHRQEVTETILNTQEEERRRIAESLHNGLGQILYGVKLSLSQVNIKTAEEPQLNQQVLRETTDLLTLCILECRRISHDLMPAILEDFGFKKAIIEICQQLTSDVKFDCTINGMTPQTDKFLELAIYRIVQELLMNVVKHAEATRVKLVIKGRKMAVDIGVEDNGKGFDAHSEQHGIGLQTIRDKVKLLTGSLKISSKEGKGTAVKITIPKRIA